jgi:hypothetical protein
LGHANGLGKPVLSDIHRLEEILQQNFTGMHRRHFSLHRCTPSMVIGKFKIMGMTVLPMKADPPSVSPPHPLSNTLFPDFDPRYAGAGNCVFINANASQAFFA